jgi:hypothetical protein
MHVAQVMKLAREHSGNGYTPGAPEDAFGAHVIGSTPRLRLRRSRSAASRP